MTDIAADTEIEGTDIVAECLACLPQLSDLIPKVEKKIKMYAFRDFGRADPGWPESTYGAWNRVQYDRYGNFLRAGKRWCILPCACCSGIEDKDATLYEDLGPAPFSALAMQAALDICAYTQRVEGPEDIRLFAQAMLDLVKSELKECFENPQSCLDAYWAVSPASSSSKKAVSAEIATSGAAVAAQVRLAIESRLLGISVWANILETLEHVHWDDEETTAALAADPGFARKTRRIPLCSVLREIQHHEAYSGKHLRVLFNKWWNKGTGLSVPTPASSFALRLVDETSYTTPEREALAKSLVGLSRFEKAVVRVCRPALHPITPFQINLLDMEQQLRERPTRAHTLPDALLKAIGYHAMVVHAHDMIFRYICRKSRWKPTAASLPCPPEPYIHPYNRVHPTPANLVRPSTEKERLFAIFFEWLQVEKTSRDSRVLWFATYTSRVNWSRYITFGSPKAHPTIYGRALRTDLDEAARAEFGCGILDMLNQGGHAVFTWVPHKRDLCGPMTRDDLGKQIILHLRDVADPRATCIYESDPKALLLTAQPLSPTTSADLLAVQLSSVSIAQSSHAYLRDNPPVLKTARSTEQVPTQPALPPLQVETKPLPPFVVNNKQMKLVEKLFGTREGSVSWASLDNLFSRLGYRMKGMGGTAYHVTPVDADGSSLILYRPHPSHELSYERAVALGNRLASTFGWSLERFVRPSDSALNQA